MSDDRSDDLAAMKRELEQLRREVHELRGGRRATMRGDVRCPACGGESILHANEILDGDGGGRGQLAVAQPSIWSARRVGAFEAYICAGCCYVEWYVQSTYGLEPDGKNIEIVTPPEREVKGPYR